MEIAFDRNKIYIDVRSESEFAKGHITGAVNLPILYDSERAEVGFIYKQVSVEDAKRAGVEFASTKLKSFYNQVERLAKKHGESNLVFYCARGGYRSESVYLFFKGLGLQTLKLHGGYKNYRSLVLRALDSAESHFPAFIGINGLTGSGKTKIIEALRNLGEPTLDLERAARHKGSNLGHIGMTMPQCAQQFENDVFTELECARDFGYCFVEMESRKIGSLLVPKPLYEAYHEKTDAKIWIESPMEQRIDFLLKDYAEMPHFEREFSAGMEKIQRYIPAELYRRIVEQLEKGDYRKVTEMLLKEYYDPLYTRSTKEYVPDLTLTLHGEDYDELARRIVDFRRDHGADILKH